MHDYIDKRIGQMQKKIIIAGYIARVLPQCITCAYFAKFDKVDLYKNFDFKVY